MNLCFGLLAKPIYDCPCVASWASLLCPYNCPQGDPFVAEVVFYDTSLLVGFVVDVILDRIARCSPCLGCDSNVGGHAASVQNGPK